MTPSFHVVIPARLGSSRLPRKVILPLAGKPVVQWGWEACCLAGAQTVTIAVDSEEVAAICRDFGAEVVMTNPQHQSGTDRAHEVATIKAWSADAIVVNVQGDEPCMPAALIADVAQLLANDPAAAIATLAHPIHQIDDFLNPNVVKVVADACDYALYFSRAPIPWQRDGSNNPWLAGGSSAVQLPERALRHIGLYAYRVGGLKTLAELPPAELENVECLEQLRALTAGLKIKMGYTDQPPPRGVDTQADLDALEWRFMV